MFPTSRLEDTSCLGLRVTGGVEGMGSGVDSGVGLVIGSGVGCGVGSVGPSLEFVGSFSIRGSCSIVGKMSVTFAVRSSKQ